MVHVNPTISTEETPAVKTAKKRGRPRKQAAVIETAVPPRRRGRPKKAVLTDSADIPSHSTMHADQQKKRIQDAFLFVAGRAKKSSDITMIKIAAAAGLSTQSIYKDYYKNVEEIVSSVEEIVVNNFRVLINTERTGRLSPFLILADEVLPKMYDDRLRYQIFFRQGIFPNLLPSLEQVLAEWLSPYWKKKLVGIRVPRDIFTTTEIQFLLSVFATWFQEDKPIPVSLFHDQFLEIIRFSHLNDYIDAKYKKRRTNHKAVPKS